MASLSALEISYLTLINAVCKMLKKIKGIAGAQFEV
jgi:hypothetical protein